MLRVLHRLESLRADIAAVDPTAVTDVGDEIAALAVALRAALAEVDVPLAAAVAEIDQPMRAIR